MLSKAFCLVATATLASAASRVAPVTVVIETLEATVTEACADYIPDILTAGATDIVIGWYDGSLASPAPIAASALVLWEAMTTPAAAGCKVTLTGIGNLILGVKAAAWSTTVTTVLSTAATFAATNGFDSIMWDIENMPAAPVAADVTFVTTAMTAAVATGATTSVFLSVPATYISPNAGSATGGLDPTLFASLDAITDHAKLKRIIVQYYNSGTDFSTEASIFTTATSTTALESSIAELEAAATNLKTMFGVGKPMNVAAAGSVPADFIDLATLAGFVCNAQAKTPAYTEGVALFSYLATDATAFAAGNFGADCADAPPVASSTVAPAGGSSTVAPAGGSSTAAPAGGSSTVAPAGGSSTSGSTQAPGSATTKASGGTTTWWADSATTTLALSTITVTAILVSMFC